MSRTFVLMAMIFCHIIDDFCLQAFWLNNGKQKAWWERNACDPMYRYDYKAALIIHGISWSFMISLPVMAYYKFDIPPGFAVVVLFNAIAHAVVDDEKANNHSINLITDQLIHLFQIVMFWVTMLL